MKRDLDDIRQRLDALGQRELPPLDLPALALHWIRTDELPADLHERKHVLAFLFDVLARGRELPAPKACSIDDLRAAHRRAVSAGHAAADDFLGMTPSTPRDELPATWRTIEQRARELLQQTTAAILQRAQQLDDGTPPPSPVWL